MLEPHKEDEALNRRAKIIYDEIQKYCEGESLLDIGCSNGHISNLLKPRFNRIQLLDVVQYLPRGLQLPFIKYEEGLPLSINESYDVVLLLTVLHHATKPDELLKMAWGATKRRLLIIESVVGVSHVEPPVRFALAGLSEQVQIGYAAFVDWFYNRVLNENVPVPYNFARPEHWETLFAKYKMNCVKTVHLGQDIDIGPNTTFYLCLINQDGRRRQTFRE